MIIKARSVKGTFCKQYGARLPFETPVWQRAARSKLKRFASLLQVNALLKDAVASVVPHSTVDGRNPFRTT